MEKASISICLIVLFGLVANVSATSPMPEEVKPGMTATVCTIHITCTTDRDRGILEEKTSTFAFEVSEAKKDVLEWVTNYVNNKLKERNVAEFRIDCKFPKQ